MVVGVVARVDRPRRCYTLIINFYNFPAMSEEKNQITKSELVVFMEGEKIGTELQTSLLEKFQPFFEQAKEWNDKALALEITSVEQVEQMKEARVARLALVKVRTSLDALRKKLNEDDKARIDARNGVAKFLTAMIVPTEAHLEKQEKFIEAETVRLTEEKKSQRVELLTPYGEIPGYIDLSTMPDELFDQLLKDTKMLHEAKIENKRKQDEEIRIAKMMQERHAQLVELGFAVDQHGDFTHPFGLMANHTNLSKESEVWGDFLDHIKNEIKQMGEEQAAAEAEQQRKAHEDSMRILTLQRGGFVPGEIDDDLVPKEYINHKYNITLSASILDDSKEKFDLTIAEVNAKVREIDEEERKRKADEAAAAKAEADRVQALKDGIIKERAHALTGLGFVQQNGYMKHPQGFGESILVKSLADPSTEKFVDFMKKLTANVAQMAKEAREEQERKEATEASEREAAMSDKERIVEFHNKMKELHKGLKNTVFKSNKNLRFFKDVAESMEEIVVEIADAYKL